MAGVYSYLRMAVDAGAVLGDNLEASELEGAVGKELAKHTTTAQQGRYSFRRASQRTGPEDLPRCLTVLPGLSESFFG